MDRNQWVRFVTDELTKLAPDKDAMKRWVERQSFKVNSAADLPAGGWWFSAESQRMTFTKLTVRWDENKTPSQLSVEAN
jgi:hypothetical protein